MENVLPFLNEIIENALKVVEIRIYKYLGIVSK